MNSERTGKRVSETANHMVGDKVAHWLRMAYRDSVTKRAAQQFNVSEGTAKRWKRGVPPTAEHLNAMAKAWGWRFVEFIYSPVCAGPNYDSRLAADVNELKARLTRLEATTNDGAQAAGESRADEDRPQAHGVDREAVTDRPARPAVDPETNARLLRAFEVQKRRIAPWGGR